MRMFWWLNIPIVQKDRRVWIACTAWSKSKSILEKYFMRVQCFFLFTALDISASYLDLNNQIVFKAEDGFWRVNFHGWKDCKDEGSGILKVATTKQSSLCPLVSFITKWQVESFKKVVVNLLSVTTWQWKGWFACRIMHLNLDDGICFWSSNLGYSLLAVQKY